jgi:hypothetical protein
VTIVSSVKTWYSIIYVVSTARMSAASENQSLDYDMVVLAVANPCGSSQCVLGSANVNRTGLQTLGTQYNQRANGFRKTTNVFWYVWCKHLNLHRNNRTQVHNYSLNNIINILGYIAANGRMISEWTEKSMEECDIDICQRGLKKITKTPVSGPWSKPTTSWIQSSAIHSTRRSVTTLITCYCY